MESDVKIKRGETAKPARTRTSKESSNPGSAGGLRAFLHEHSLSLVAASVLVSWICLYCIFDPSSHIGSFFGNAIADWLGVVVMVLATKYFYEIGSAESNPPPQARMSPVLQLLRKHSLSIFVALTGIGWVLIYAAMDSEAKWGQVVGNIVSEWTQIFGLILLTKRLTERHSKESAAPEETDRH